MSRGTRVFALYERKTETQKKITYRFAEGWIADCVNPDRSG
jgi:hypothetical protein